MKLINRISFFILLLGFVVTNNLSAQSNKQLIVFHAGSLTVPFEKIINGFEKENPGVEVLKEIAGSRECARKISELKKPCDVFASADYLVIDQLLIPNHADWNLKFATNEMTITYSPKSRRAKEISTKNWYEVLLDEKVNIGRADPNADPCGYRTVLSLKLADIYYKKNLSRKILSKDNEYIRPKEVDLLALLEAGEVDYIFLYRSVAEQHGLKYLILPDQINLKKAELEEHYKLVSTELSGKKPGEKITQVGSSMVYGVTIPKNSPNPELAKKFVQYLMNKKKGLKVMQEMGQPVVVPSVCNNYNKLPKELKQFAKEK
ncbi:MAG: extracellular solute-binding protein [Melioribacteraceae bacterium]